MSVCLYVCMFVCEYGFMSLCIYVCMSVCLHVRMSVCLFMCLYVCVYVCHVCKYQKYVEFLFQTVGVDTSRRPRETNQICISLFSNFSYVLVTGHVEELC